MERHYLKSQISHSVAGDARARNPPFAWPLLLQTGRLAEISGSQLRLTRAGRQAMTEPPHEVIRELWTRWLNSTLFDEFRRIGEVKGQTRPRAMSAPAPRREAIVIGLRSAPVGQWIEVDEFMRCLVASGQSFQVANEKRALYICDPHYGSLGYEGFADWLPKWYAMVFLREYAATLGLIDVAFTVPQGGHTDYCDNWGTDGMDCLSPHDGLYYFRINRLGAWVLGLVSEFLPPQEELRPALRVRPNLEIEAIDRELSPADSLLLDRFAHRRTDRIWSLELKGLMDAVEQGLPLSRIWEFIDTRSAEPGIPPAVAALFDDAKSRIGRIVDQGPARIYACDDPQLAQLLLSDRKLRRFCRLADDHLLVVPASVDSSFREALRALGYAAPPSPAR